MRVVRLVDEADWKSLWPIVENIFFATMFPRKRDLHRARLSLTPQFQARQQVTARGHVRLWLLT
jgi:hypothetical protein